MELEFDDELWFWRGPAPWHFLSIPDDQCDAIESVAASVTYGWGMIPGDAQIGATRWYTALWPKDGGFILPVKTAVRRVEDLHLGDRVTARWFIHL